MNDERTKWFSIRKGSILNANEKLPPSLLSVEDNEPGFLKAKGPGAKVKDDGSFQSKEEQGYEVFLYNLLLGLTNYSIFRNITLYTYSIAGKLILNLFGFVIVGIATLVFIVVVPGYILDSFLYFNAFHIAFHISGHLLYIFTENVLEISREWIIASQISSHGCSIDSLASGIYSSSTPGNQVRILIKILGVCFPIAVGLNAYYFEWIPTTSVFTTDVCIPATYTHVESRIPNLGEFIQGEMDLALIYTYGIPLEDGIIGGWSAWPLINPYNQFSLTGEGIGYVVGVECFPPISSNSLYDETKFKITNLKQNENFLYGELEIYVPQGSMILDNSVIEDRFGFIQDCNFNFQFFEAETTISFKSDEWEMVTLENLISLTVQNSTISATTNSNRYVREFLKYANVDKYNLADNFLSIIDQLFNDTSFHSSQGAKFCNLLQWATLPDGFYHDSLMWKGVSTALASGAHYLLLQYDQNQISSCDYYANRGSGYLTGDKVLLLLVEIILILLGSSVVLHLWWIYLLFGFDRATSIAHHTLDSKVNFARICYKSGESVFSKSVSTTESFDEDLLKKIGSNKIYYGALFKNMNDDDPELAIGDRKQIITLRKLLHRRNNRIVITDAD
ncbi:hypothetical protein HDV06_004619 [Boothiomyces sp. JEL0866]|nr:hypothetical protein HDV06_004619 [Boothiomyces sp. JEL0866]